VSIDPNRDWESEKWDLVASDVGAAASTHASNHTDGTDDIQSATAAQKGLMTAAYGAKLDGIEAGATADQTAGEIEAIVNHDNLLGFVAGEHRAIDDAGTAATDLWSAQQIGLATRGKPDFQSSRYYTSAIQSIYVMTTVKVGTGTIFYTPLLVPAPTTLETIAAEITTASAFGNIRLGLYDDSGGLPDTLLHDSGNISAATTGIKTDGTISQAVVEGWYWFGFQASDNTVYMRAHRNSYCSPVLGTKTTTIGQIITQLTEAQVFGAFPATANVGGTSVASATAVVVGI